MLVIVSMRVKCLCSIFLNASVYSSANTAYFSMSLSLKLLMTTYILAESSFFLLINLDVALTSLVSTRMLA